MNTFTDLTNAPITSLIAKDLNSNVRSGGNTTEEIANLYPNVRDCLDCSFLSEVRTVARKRRANQIRRASVARRVVVLCELERSIPLEEHGFFRDDTQNPYQFSWDRINTSINPQHVKNLLVNVLFQTTGICGPLFDPQALQERYTSELEKLVFLVGALREQGSWSGVASTIMLYARTHYTGSVLSMMTKAFTEYFDCLEQHAGFADWLETIKMTHTNWKLATQNEGFQHVSKLLSMLIGAGLIEATSMQCDVGGMKLFTDLCIPKFVSAFDLLDASMSCIAFFVEGGYECIQSGSINPLIFGEKDFSNFDDAYLECKKLYGYAQPGNYHMMDTDENAVVKKLVDTITEGKRLIQLTKNPLSKRMISDRIGKLQEMESVLQQHRLSSGVRMKPFCAVAFGPTGVGKSTIAPLLMYHILQPNGFDASDDACLMMKAGQKHEENYRTYINGVYYDDFANTKAEFVSESPCEDLLDTVNTARSTARMAALELKSKVSKQPKAVVVSTNVKDLNATKYSEEPASITRRADVFLIFRVREQFQCNGMLDSALVEEHYGGNVPAVPDLWEIDLEISYPVVNPTPGRHDTIGWKQVVWNGKPMVGVDMKTALQYIVVASRQHFVTQKAMVERSTGLSSKLSLCPTCKSSADVCVCGLTHNVGYNVVRPPPTPKSQPQKRKPPPRRGGQERNSSIGDQRKREAVYAKATAVDGLLSSELEEHAVSDTVLRYVTHLETLYPYVIRSLVPQRWTRSYAVLSVLRMFIKHESAKYHVCFGFLIPYFIQDRILALFAFLTYLYCLYILFMSYVEIVEQNVSQQRQASWHKVQHVAFTTAKILGAGVLLRVLYGMAKKYYEMRALRRPLTEQGFMNPTEEEIAARDESTVDQQIAVEHNWANVQIAPLPASETSRTIAEEDLMNLCKRSTAVISVEGKAVSNMFFIKSNVALVPTHLIKKWVDKLCVITRQDAKQVGGNFKCFLSVHHSAAIPDTDLSVVWVPNGGSWKDLSKYLPLKKYEDNCAIRMCTRDLAGTITEYKTRATFGTQQLTSCVSKGYSYEVDSFIGMCGAPVVAQKIAPMIIGIHVAGRVAQKLGFASAITQSDIEYALEVLKDKPSVLLAHSSGTLKPTIFDKPILTEQAIHAKSPVNRLEITDVTPNMNVYGSCDGRATYHSKVQKSIISDIVTDVCGVPNRWGKPKFGKGDPWLESLKHSSKPSFGVEPSLLDRAVKDYLKPLYKLLEDRPKLRADIKPLTRMQVVCGIDGKRFIDKMPPNTSVGFPLSGPKSNHLTYLDPDEYPDFSCPAVLDAQFWTEYDEAIACWSNGERYHAVFKACMKDEPTPLDKDKVRVFQAAPIVLQLAVRKYFLPIARFMSLFPAVSECAVGLNPMGPEWEDFQGHITKYGKDRILAGDYSKYDLRMPAQITMASFRVFINLAVFCGYSSADIKIMHGIATDIVYPTIAFNGDLLEMLGTNPSGNNITVHVNGTGNSLQVRCAFFKIEPEEEDFRAVVAAGTYGDDLKSSVKAGHDKFNHISVAEFFAERDMKFTMPDKTSTPIPYMKDQDADFIKRHNKWIPELKCHVGALDEDSIFKSLHSNLKSKALTPVELSATCIDGALREWFFHGAAKYNQRWQEMNEIAERADIKHFCTMLSDPDNANYDYLASNWYERYNLDPLAVYTRHGEP